MITISGEMLKGVQYFVPSIGSQPLLTGVQTGKLGRWDAVIGKILWKAELGDAGCSDPVFTDTAGGTMERFPAAVAGRVVTA